MVLIRCPIEKRIQVEVFSFLDGDLRTSHAGERLRRRATALYQPNMQNGRMCLVSAGSQMDIRTTDKGRIVGATTEECVTRHKGDYPASYQCQPRQRGRTTSLIAAPAQRASRSKTTRVNGIGRSYPSLRTVNSVTTGPLSISICAS